VVVKVEQAAGWIKDYKKNINHPERMGKELQLMIEYNKQDSYSLFCCCEMFFKRMFTE
jgi:hypothetical protein